jgi:hypothetical protein
MATATRTTPTETANTSANEPQAMVRATVIRSSLQR